MKVVKIAFCLLLVAASLGARAEAVEIAVDFRPSPRTLGSADEFQSVTWDGGDWSGAEGAATLSVLKDEGAARTLVDGGLGSGSLVFTPMGAGRYHFTHIAGDEELVAEFVLESDAAVAGDVATLRVDERVFTKENPREIADLAEDLWPVSYSGAAWAKNGAGTATVTLDDGASAAEVLGATVGEGEFTLEIAAEGLATLRHAAGGETLAAHLKFADGVTVEIDTDGDGVADTVVPATGGGEWLADEVEAVRITAIERGTGDGSPWLITFRPKVKGAEACAGNFGRWYRASALNGKIRLRRAETLDGLKAAEAQAKESSADGGEVTARDDSEPESGFWQVEIAR